MPLGKELNSKTVHLRIECFAIYLNAGETRPRHRGDDDETMTRFRDPLSSDVLTLGLLIRD